MIRRDNVKFQNIAEMSKYKISASKTNDSYRQGSFDGPVIAGEPDIMWQSVVYLLDEHIIWTHGSIFTAGGAGSGNIFVDAALSESSEHPVQNKVITSTIKEIKIVTDDELKALTEKVDGKVDKTELKTVYGQVLIGEGDVMAETLTDEDVINIFNEA